MLKAARLTSMFVAVSLTAVGLAACGGGTSDNVVAQVGGTPITKAELNHWMTAMAGGDFYELAAGRTVPLGLVSEPPNYAGCVSRLEAEARPSKGQIKPTAAQLLTKCRELYQRIKQQALSFLVDAQWTIGLYAEEGVKATDGEVKQMLDRMKAEQFPQEPALQTYLVGRRRSMADELLYLKINLLSRKMLQKVEAGGKPVLAKLTAGGQRWTAKTTCRAGYVVKHCKQYKGEPSSSTPPASVLLEQIAVVTGSSCINRPACG